MSQEEVILSTRRSGDPNAETGAEWEKMLASIQPGDELRMVDCIRHAKGGLAAGYYYYALFRGETIVATMQGVIIN